MNKLAGQSCKRQQMQAKQIASHQTCFGTF